MHGLLFNCSAERHTLEARSTAESDCLCRPGTRDVAGTCEQCPADTFCVGDETVETCPAHAQSAPGSVALLDCKCSEGFAATFNASSLSCASCAAGKFKSVLANTACQTCTACSAANDAVYEHEACRATADAVCLPCSTCSAGGQYVSAVCQDLLDATCANCSVCDYSTEYTHTPCRATAPTQDTVCADITFALDCAPGFFRGQHTQASNSFCAPCTYRDTAYLGYRLHAATGQGQRYNDPESCPIECLGFSRLANASAPVHGCVTCEDGNVLLKQFEHDPTDVACLFSCGPGYERVALEHGDDCVLAPLPASASTSFTHTVRVTDYDRYDGGAVLSVAHSNHSRFLVVVGSTAPTTCKQVRGCCYGAHWRVSELAQAGFLSTATSDGCSLEPPLEHSTVRPDLLQFRIPDARLEEVASCAWAGNATECVFTVSIIDTLLWYVASEQVRLVTRRAAQHAVLGGQEYLPLTDFAVDVFLAYTSETGEHVYALRTRMATQLPTLGVQIRVTGMTREEDVAGTFAVCLRLQLQADVAVLPSNAFALSADATHSSLSFWRGSLDTVRAYFRLDMAAGNDMTVAAVRDMRNFSALCAPAVHFDTVDVLRVTAVSGLGRPRVDEMTWLADSEHALRGELDTLTTFFVQAVSATPTRFFLRDMLAVYLRTPAAETAIAPLVANATTLAHGHLDFAYAFRQACRAQGQDCAYDYLRASDPHAAVYAMHGCAPADQDAARAWLRANFGVPHDGEHVAALCERAAQPPARSSAIFFAKTLAFLDRSVWGRWQDPGMHAVRTYAWGNFGAETL